VAYSEDRSESGPEFPLIPRMWSENWSEAKVPKLKRTTVMPAVGCHRLTTAGKCSR